MYSFKSYSASILLAISLAMPVPSAWGADGVVEIADAGPATVCFTTGNQSAPGADCTRLVVEAVDGARSSLLVQAYNFSEPRIVAAIAAAFRRGVAVTVLLDKTSPSQKGAGAPHLAAEGVPVYIDVKPRIAHNKVMIVDETMVVTGSFNFTTSAWERNAENLLVLHSSDLARAYIRNFRQRFAVSVAYLP